MHTMLLNLVTFVLFKTRTLWGRPGIATLFIAPAGLVLEDPNVSKTIYYN